MLIYSASHFVLPLPATHRFPMRKYALLHDRIAAQVPEFLRVPAALEDAELGNAHSTDYVAAVAGGTLAMRPNARGINSVIVSTDTKSVFVSGTRQPGANWQVQSPRPGDELGVEESEFDKPTYLRRGLYAPE